MTAPAPQPAHVPEAGEEIPVRLVRLWLCDPCLDGEGGECHTPGCAMFINRAPDIPLRNSPLVAILPEPPAPEVWNASVPPGGYVCSACGVPVESEPCPDHGAVPAPEAATPALLRSFEDMLADPHEQFDGRSELLVSIAEYAAAPPASAGIQPPEAPNVATRISRERDALAARLAEAQQLAIEVIAAYESQVSYDETPADRSRVAGWRKRAGLEAPDAG